MKSLKPVSRSRPLSHFLCFVERSEEHTGDKTVAELLNGEGFKFVFVTRERHRVCVCVCKQAVAGYIIHLAHISQAVISGAACG